MGIRIHKAIGYGFPLNKRTINHTNVQDEEIIENLYDSFDFETLFEKYEKEYPKDFDAGWFHKEFTKIPGLELPTSLSDLFAIVTDENEDRKGILFYPPLDFKSWKRYDNTIDYHFCENMKIIFKPIHRPLYPYPLFRNLENAVQNYDYNILSGNDKKILQIVSQLKKEKAIKNYIPASLVVCIKEMKIFKNEKTIDLLQPYKAVWWS